MWKFYGMSGAGLLIAAGLIYFGLHMALKVGPYDSWDPKEPRIKW